jgi:hypothetical protein
MARVRSVYWGLAVKLVVRERLHSNLNVNHHNLLRLLDFCLEEILKIDKLTPTEAFQGMILFLETYYERTQSDEIGALLGSL